MTDEQLKLLEAPFRQDEIKQREGSFGKKLSYLEGHSVIARLNKVFNGEWSFEIVSHFIDRDADEIIVHARITAGSTIKESFGSAKIKRQRDTGTIVDLGNDMKAATTDAVKKAATLMGVALYLYGDHSMPAPSITSPVPHSAPVQYLGTDIAAPQTMPNDSHANTAEQGSSNRLSQKQHVYILKLAASAGLSKADITKYCQQAYGVVLDFISRNDASALIDALRHDRIHPVQVA